MNDIRTQFVMAYPAMSAYEFDHFKEETAVREHWSNSSLYMICQRPVLYFSDITLHSDELVGVIRQRGNEYSLPIRIPVIRGRAYFGTTSEVLIEIMFYDDLPNRELASST